MKIIGINFVKETIGLDAKIWLDENNQIIAKIHHLFLSCVTPNLFIDPVKMQEVLTLTTHTEVF